MNIDKDRYESAAASRKVDFIIKLSLFIVLIIVATVIAIMMRKNSTALIAAIFAGGWFVFSLYRIAKQSRPRDLFSKEYTGRVVRIHTEPIGKDRRDTNAELYIAKDGGGIEVILGLSNECARAYQKDDRVIHIRGTICPIITSRTPDVIPCPICAMPHTTRKGAKCPYCNS